MAETTGVHPAFGAPGIEPRWTHGDKDGVGTAREAGSRVWFTLWNGIVTECYYPRVDEPQTRDLQFLITDGKSFFHEERRHLSSATETLGRDGLAYRITNRAPDGRYTLVKEVVTAPHLPCVLQRVHLQAEPDVLETLHLYVLCAPHLGVGGAGNSALVREIGGRRLLSAEGDGVHLALGADIPFSRLSCGYVGHSDGWQDIHAHLAMEWTFDAAPDGNVALTGELDLGDAGAAGDVAFTLGLAFGDSIESAGTALLESLALPFDAVRDSCISRWRRANEALAPLAGGTGDGGRLYHRGYELLIAHEDKTFPGALIASMAIPWGEAKGDEDRGGYHLVWTRDLVSSASALIAAGDVDTARRALIYLAVLQHEDGGFPQNFWIDGTAYWHGIQLDEVAFPVILAWRLQRAGALEGFDPYPMIRRAARYLVLHGPRTDQERWEEVSGYSPSTLAANIAGLVCAADFAHERGEADTARFLLDYADFLETHVERWTVTTDGTLLDGVSRHYIRILPGDPSDPDAVEDPDAGTLFIANRPPGTETRFPAKDVVDAGFLQLVRLGIRRPGDTLVEDSLRVVDATLKVETLFGPCWRRYNHDGYGQRPDGGPFTGWGQGRAWPLLTGERGHYELAAGRDATLYLRAMERFASATGLLPEQVWDEADRPDLFLHLGRPTGSAMPLMWAHAEYIALLRSVVDGAVFDVIPAVAARYLADRSDVRRLEVWKPNRHARTVAAGATLRIQAPAPFRLHWTADAWASANDTDALATDLGIHYVDLQPTPGQERAYRFTFFWTQEERWEGRDYAVDVRP